MFMSRLFAAMPFAIGSGDSTGWGRHQSVVGQASGNLVANHLANAAFTAVGFSCAIQCPDRTTTSVRSTQSCRIGSAKRDVTVWHV